MYTPERFQEEEFFMTHRIYSTYAVVLALALPVAALADATGTSTISSSSDFSFDNGTSSSSGGDIKFTGTSITPVGSAGFFDAGTGGTATYNELTSSLIATYGSVPSLFTTAPITGSSLVVNEVFVVKTNGGNFAKVLITAVSSSSLTFQYDAVGSTVTGGTPVPSITSVVDAGSYTPNIAEGSVFVVRGSNLCPSGLSYTSFNLPPSFEGVAITFTPSSGGAGTNAYILDVFDEPVNGQPFWQLTAILPSTLPTGDYNVTVTNGTTSSPYDVQVVKSKPGLISYDGSGNGLALLQNYVSSSELDVNLYTTGTLHGGTISPAHPGQTLIFYLVGMGPVAGGDNVPSQGYNFAANGVTVSVNVGGTNITPTYAGRTPGSAGLDQIDVELPNNITTGCTVPVQITEGSNTSQTLFIAIAAAGAANCVLPGYTTSQLQALESGTMIVTTGGFSLDQESGTESGTNFSSGSVGGGFYQYTGFEIAGVTSSGSTTTPTGCIVSPIPAPTTNVLAAYGFGVALDAGTVTLNGPANSLLSNVALPETSNLYALSFGSQFTTVPNGKLTPGTYTLNGSGGTGVGKFTATLNLPALLTVTNMPTSVNRSAGLSLNWTGGNSSDLVYISGSATNTVNGVQTGASFVCFTTAGNGGYTVASSILNQLPAVTAAAISAGTGVSDLGVEWIVGGTGTFSAPLVAGGTISAGFGGFSDSATEIPFN
jgi:uncharacterized protein (TIGR03437 family)